MIVLQEYDLEIKPSNIIRGQGLCKLAVESQDQEEEEGQENGVDLMEREVSMFLPQPIQGTIKLSTT